MEMPKPTPQHQRLRGLVGSWKGDEKMHPSPWDPKGGTAKGFFESRLDLDGMFVISEYRQERDGKVTYRGYGVFGWDSKQNAYTMYWFDSMGTDPGGPARVTFDRARARQIPSMFGMPTARWGIVSLW